MKITLEQQYMLSVLRSQYHDCIWSGEVRSQCFSRLDIDPQTRNILAPVASFTTELNSRLAKRPLVFNGRLADCGLTSLVKEATEELIL